MMADTPPETPTIVPATALGGVSTKMGFLGATSYVIGNIIGSGIFITPASILRSTESPGLSLIVWFLCAIIAILGSLCYIELETFGQYLLEGLSQTYDIPKDMQPTLQKVFGISLLWLVTWMNFFELSKFAARFQIAATTAKLLSCFLIIVTGFYYFFIKGYNEGLTEPMKNSNYEIGNVLMSLYGGLYTFSGWDILNFGAGEIHRPRRNMPLALLSGIGTVTVIYLSINVAYFAVLDVETMKSSNAVAAMFSQRTLGGFSSAIPFLIGVLLIGSLNSNLFSGSRYMFAAAKQGHLPACFSIVNESTQSPRVAIAAQSVLAVAISFVGDLDALIGYVMFGFWAQRIFSLVALLMIRHNNMPVHPEAIRMPYWVIILFLCITVGLVVIPIYHEFKVTSLGLGICAMGLGFYYVLVYPTRLPRSLMVINDFFTVISTGIFNGLPEQKSMPPVNLISSDSQQRLLPSRRESFSLLSNDCVTDLHSDEKNTLIRNGSSKGLSRMW
ncbi:unnamed protein product [Bursaphelenchus xylophilus]|uniref:(pine wood nematode) hypothetical protein n=1 Tax=Bursaphelenchus xylophilus TaxID=6326 RepID=A0A7I8XHU2_BURXY|nr:unnamed protein product [Bursaphelenchus xylophilus]CAG9084849.1 unnamed protein product [Bursaphelenchus xylophilus]